MLRSRFEFYVLTLQSVQGRSQSPGHPHSPIHVVPCAAVETVVCKEVEFFDVFLMVTTHEDKLTPPGKGWLDPLSHLILCRRDTEILQADVAIDKTL